MKKILYLENLENIQLQIQVNINQKKIIIYPVNLILINNNKKFINNFKNKNNESKIIIFFCLNVNNKVKPFNLFLLKY